MTVILELAPEIEARLRRQAEQEGQDFTDFLKTVMEHKADEVKEESEGSAADLFDGRLGGIHSGGLGRWSENTGEKFALGMEEKRKQGHL